MKYVLLLSLFLISFYSHSQSLDSIPNASQQPKWFFPFIIEEGTGLRDTLYLGHDPSADPWFGDTIFGEKYYPIQNPSSFYCSVDELNGTYVKTHILNFDTISSEFLQLYITNATFPIKVYWDDIGRLYSDSLPFSSSSNAPIAQFFVGVDISYLYLTNPNHLYCNYGGNPHALVTDSILLSSTYTPIVDTLFLESWNGSSGPGSGYLVITFTKWTGDCSYFYNDINEEFNSKDLIIFPNPADKIIYFNKECKECEYTIRDIHGKTLLNSKTKNFQKIDVEELMEGLYLLKVTDKDQNIYTFKFIKS